MKKTNHEGVILLRAHFLNDEIIARFDAIRQACSQHYDVFLLFDNTSRKFIPKDDWRVHIINVEVMKSLGYPIREGRGLYYHMDYALLHFYQMYPDYRNYWVVEYDVTFKGDWAVFFDAFLDDAADLLSAYVRPYHDDPQWKWWGEHNLKVDKEKLWAIFCPVVRISNRALKVLDEKHKAGVCGYCEVIIPTLAREAGLIVEDIGERFYDPLATFNFNGIIYRQSGKLHHPDKRQDLYQRTVAMFRYIVRAKYDSHWSVQAAQYFFFKMLRFPQRAY